MMMTIDKYHIPVLLHESVSGLNIRPDGTYIDTTFGGGGHSAEILKHLDNKGRLIAFDKDPDAAANIPSDPRFLLIREDFRYMKRFLRLNGIRKVHGILADLGVSSYQFDEAGRGFSIRFDAELDMRMNPQQGISAKEIINTRSAAELTKIFREYGELKQAAKLANGIIDFRKRKPIETTGDLLTAAGKMLPPHRKNKISARIFQALRIEVNDEIQALKDMLMQTPDLLLPGGRLCVISYQSLEDRLVKRFIRNGMFEGEPEKDLYGNAYVPLKKIGKLIIPGDEEIQNNNRARSAKLRIAQRI